MYIIVEDTGLHMKNAIEASSNLGLAFSFADCLACAYYLLGEYEKAEFFGDAPKRPVIHPPIQGVITDIHFLRSAHDIMKPEPYGVEIALYCHLHKISCVICTDIDHHKSHWIERFGEMIGVPVVVDKAVGVEAWERAMILLTKPTNTIVV